MTDLLLMKLSIRTYITISIVCFLILSAVQFYLVQNTYELKNQQYYFEEKNLMKESYSRSIANDKLFPGGQKIIDSFIYQNFPQLELLYKTNQNEFDIYKQRVIDTIARELRKKESIKPFLAKYKKEKNIADSLEYAVTFDLLDVVFSDLPYVNMYSKNNQYTHIEKKIQEPSGLRIGGGLKDPNDQNRIQGITVSSANPYTYRIGFSLYAEPVDRKATILRQMGLILILSLLSILTILVLFFVTFRNWMKQKKLSEMKSDFINSVTHELHTPLAAITVASKSLQNEKIIERKENITPLTNIIQRQADRLTALISQVLDTASMDKIILNKKEYSVHNLLDEILLDYRLNLTGTNIHLTFDKAAENDKVLLDQFHFTSIILNILDNAIKYNNNPVKSIVVSTQNEKNQLLIIINDNGIGMTRETIHNIFDKFYRNTSNLLNNQSKGLGLGLYYVKRSIHTHGWEITVKSKPEEGSTFIITIPLQNQA